MTTITLLKLPLEVLLNIIKYLTISDLRNAMLTCKSLKDIIINDHFIWKDLFRNNLIIDNNISGRQCIQYHLCRTSHNWCKGIFKNKILLYHDTNYLPWIQYYNSKILVVSVGSEIRCYAIDKKGSLHKNKSLLWKLDVPKVKRNDVRTNDVSRFIIKNNYLVCGNRDGSTSVYQINTIAQAPNLVHLIQDCHKNGLVEVSAVHIINNSKLVTGSNYCSQLSFWTITRETNNENICFSVNLPNLGLGVRCLAVNSMDDTLVVGPNGSNSPILVDIITGQIIQGENSVNNYREVIRDIQFQNNTTVTYVTHSGYLYSIDTRTNQNIYKIMDPFDSSLYCVRTDGANAIVVGCSEYSRCVLFDARNYSKHVQMYYTQNKHSPVYCLEFNSTTLISAADRSLAVLDFNVNLSSTPIRDYSYTFECIKR